MREYIDASYYVASIRQNIRQPLSAILGTRAARMKERQPSEPHVRGHETRRANERPAILAKCAELRNG